MMCVGKPESRAASIRTHSLLLLLLLLTCRITSRTLTRRNTPSVELNASSISPISQANHGYPGGSTPPLSLTNVRAGTSVSTIYPVDCFRSSEYLEVAIASDCEFIINEIILRLPNPMQEQSFGFNDSVDINLSLDENHSWYHGQCLISVGSRDHDNSDVFRPVDVAITAQRILQECVIMSKDAVGGSAGIGSILKRFHVILGGLVPPPGSSHPPMPFSPPTITSKRSISLEELPTKSLERRSNNPSIVFSSTNLELRSSCVKHGMPADAGAISVEDCMATARILLGDPRVFDIQKFTTESTGGIHVPFLQNVGNCYFMVNTHSHYSSSESFSFLKIVYYASEVLRRCPLGGVAKLTRQGGFFLSVTSRNPTGPAQADLMGSMNSTFIELGLQSIQFLKKTSNVL